MSATFHAAGIALRFSQQCPQPNDHRPFDAELAAIVSDAVEDLLNFLPDSGDLPDDLSCEDVWDAIAYAISDALNCGGDFRVRINHVLTVTFNG